MMDLGDRRFPFAPQYMRVSVGKACWKNLLEKMGNVPKG